MTPTTSSDVLTLATWMAGDFSNWEQAIENPPLFAHIRVAIRPLPLAVVANLTAETDGGIWLYSEQAYDFEMHRPYRTAVLYLFDRDDHIEIKNHKIKDAPAYFGGSRDPEKLLTLKQEHLEPLDRCSYQVVRTERHTFKGIVEPGKGCAVERNGKKSYLESEFEVSEHTLSSLDRGRDPLTDVHVWGSIAGAFEFTKKAGFPLAE